LTHDLHEFRFETDEPARFRPGQYALLTLPGVNAPRAYSMANLPNESGQWHFQIRRVPGGEATSVLFDRLPIGLSVALDGPYGLAWLREDAGRDIVCIAGGSGLAPMIAIARGAAAAGLLGPHRLYFFYGARTPADVCGESLLAELPGFGHALQYVPVVSGDSAGWSGQTGFVHEAVERTMRGDFAAHEFYFAGPPPMTQAVQEMLMVRHRVPYTQIHFDRFY
jgi:toluene monooxygenase electron transfer component